MYKEKRLFAKHKKKRPKTMSKFINPFTDYGFKLIFGREVSKDFTNRISERPARR